MKDKESLKYAAPLRAESPCEGACPVSLKCHSYISLIKEGEFEKAFRAIRQRLPFPRTLGRICDRPCEAYCRRADIDDAIEIRELKRVVADHAHKTEVKYRPTVKRSRKEKVAIVGSGPAGLSAAYDLAREGFSVTVFEALPIAGGMMAMGCPEFKLPKKILEDEIKNVVELGVEIKLNSKISDLKSLFQQGYQAVFVAPGMQTGKEFSVPGSDLQDVLIATALLKDVNLGKDVKMGRSVLVIGGGNVAVDTARVAIRLGAEEVHLACVESEDEMPAYPEAIAHAKQEGIVIHPSRSLCGILSREGKVSGAECLKVNQFEFDETGRPVVDIISGSEHTLAADMIVFAIGQVSEVGFVSESGIEVAKQGFIVADPDTLVTNVPWVFAGGDAVSNSGSVVQAIADGQRAALSITSYLNGEKPSPLTKRWDDEPIAFPSKPPDETEVLAIKKKVMPSSLSIEERKCSFKEDISVYSIQDAKEEASRCLRCDAVEETMAGLVGMGTDSVDSVEEMIAREGGMGLTAGTMRRALLGGLQLRLKHTPEKVENIICTGCYVWGTPYPVISLTRILKHFGVPYAFLAREECCGAPAIVSADTKGTEEQRYKAIDLTKRLNNENILRAQALGGKNIYQMCQWCTYIANYWFRGKSSVGLNYYVDFLVRVIQEFQPSLRLDGTVGYFAGGRHRHAQFYQPGTWDLDWAEYRAILDKIKGLTVVDLEPYCCVTHPGITMKTMEEKGLDTLVTPCITCYGRLMRKAAENIRVITTADLIFEALSGQRIY